MPSLLEKFESLSREEQDGAIVTRIKQGRSKKELCLLFAIPSSRITEALASVKTRQDKSEIEEATIEDLENYLEEGLKPRHEKVTKEEESNLFDTFWNALLWLFAIIAFLDLVAIAIGIVELNMRGNATVLLIAAGLPAAFFLTGIILRKTLTYWSKTTRHDRKIAKDSRKAKGKQQREMAKQREEERLKKEYDAQVLREAEYRKKREENPLQGVQTAVRIILSLMIAAGLIGCIMCFAMMGQSSNGQQSDKAVSYLFYCIGATATTFLILCLFEVLFAINANLQKKSKE